MTQPTPETDPGTEQAPADEQPTMRLEPANPDATRPMSLADLLDS